MPGLPAEFFDKIQTLGIAETSEILTISVSEQRLRLFKNRLCAVEYAVSTAEKGIGCHRDSYQTPVGLHRISQKIGKGQPSGTIFKERKPAGKCQSIKSGSLNAGTNHDDLILTRILWLEGLEPGVNRGGDVDTFSRYIYIHGTNREDLLGQPDSHGCIRMRNADVKTLFDSVELGSLVWIG
jgi:hypothetical protein